MGFANSKVWDKHANAFCLAFKTEKKLHPCFSYSYKYIYMYILSRCDAACL